MRLLALTVLLALVSSAAWAENPATIEFGCAPWDGRALAIKVGAPDAVYHATLWTAGIKALESITHAVTVDNKLESSGMGTGSVCGTNIDGQTKCTQEVLRVELRTADLKPGSTVAGSITFKDMVIPFIGTVGAHREICG